MKISSIFLLIHMQQADRISDGGELGIFNHNLISGGTRKVKVFFIGKAII